MEEGSSVNGQENKKKKKEIKKETKLILYLVLEISPALNTLGTGAGKALRRHFFILFFIISFALFL